MKLAVSPETSRDLNVAKTQTSDSHATSDIQVLDINRLHSKYIIFLTLGRNGWSFLDLLARGRISNMEILFSSWFVMIIRRNDFTITFQPAHAYRSDVDNSSLLHFN